MTRIFISCLLFLLSGALFAQQRYEAEDAILDGGANVRDSEASSEGKYVFMEEGTILFDNVQVQETGAYEMKIRFSQTQGDYKAQNLVVNGIAVGAVAFLETGPGPYPEFEETTKVISLQAGTNTIAITKSWGWVDIDYIELTKHLFTPFTIDTHPVTPEPTESAMKLYSFLRNNFQQKTISGVMTSDVMGQYELPLPLINQPEVNHIYNSSGKMPALVGLDFMNSTIRQDENWFKAFTIGTLSLATELWEAGGIPAFCWHWRDPLHNEEEFYTDKTSFHLTNAFTDLSCTEWKTDSEEYNAIIRDIDNVSDLLKGLQDKDIAILWRPLHEASGGWFWWGRDKNETACKALYRLMFNRMVNDNGIHNLIWVWTADGADYDWYPGDDYVDMIGRDFYFDPRQANHSSLIGEFETLKSVFGTNKMIALAENGSIPYPDAMQADNANWSYFMPWNGEFVMPINGSNDNTVDDWHFIMNHDYVITLEDMPGWQDYIYTKVEEIIDNKDIQALVYPTRVKDIVYVVCPDSHYSIVIADSGGKIISFISTVNGNTTISCSNWNSGIYYLSVITQNGKRTFRVIK